MILSAAQIRDIERQTMQNEPIASIDLMERAGTTFVNQLCQDVDLDHYDQAVIFCGCGNNGGDGLVIARLLAEKKMSIIVCTTIFGKKTTPEFDTNLARFEKLASDPEIRAFIYDYDTYLNVHSEARIDPERTLCIDAIFGIGISRPVSNEYADVINHINTCYRHIISVDIPSGMFPDTHLPYRALCVSASRTYTFGFMKWAFCLPSHQKNTGEVTILDIGFQFDQQQNIFPFREEMVHPVTKENVQLARLNWADPYAHKGTFGHALLMAGSQKMPGAALLCAEAAMRSGLGKLTVHTTANVAAVLPIRLPEAILSIDTDPECISQCHWEEMTDIRAMAIGPGIGKGKKTKALLKDLLSEVHSPIIFDADAINLLAEDKTLLGYLPEYSILTPHLGEFQRLVGTWTNDYECIIKAQQFSLSHHIILILKGHETAVIIPTQDGASVNIVTTGNNGMATAGSGDVLTGILLGLMCRTQDPCYAAVAAAYLHGRAGDLAADKHTAVSMIASDICHEIGNALHP